MSESCFYCGEPILPGEPAYRNDVPQVFHQECIFRMGSGSAAHIRGECKIGGIGSCVEPDTMSLREGARAALAQWRALHPSCEHG